MENSRICAAFEQAKVDTLQVITLCCIFGVVFWGWMDRYLNPADNLREEANLQARPHFSGI